MVPKLPSVLILVFIVAGCGVLPQPATPTPTRNFSAPTLAPTATTAIRNSDELYGDTQFGGVGQNNLTAAALPNEGALPPLSAGTREPGGAETVQLFLDDGRAVLGDLYEPVDPEERVPGVLIIGRDRLSWGLLPAELFGAGFTVLVLELPPDIRVASLDALLTSFSENGTVDPGHIALAGAQDTADMALLGCATFAICDAAVLLSPQGRDTLLNVLPNYSPRPLFIAAGQNDETGHASAAAIADFYADNVRFIEVASGRGTSLLALNSDLSRTIASWLQEALSSS